MHDEQLVLKLNEIKAIQFGEFTLKSGIISPIYIDLRITVSYPKLLEMVANAIWEKIKRVHFDLLCGVPYTALPICTAMAITHSKPMVMRRKEVKDYGTKKAIEGDFSPEQVCMVIEDLVTSGASTLETIEALTKEELVVSDAAVLIDREQGGEQNLKEAGCTLHAALTISQILETLEKHQHLTSAQTAKVKTFLAQNQTHSPAKV